MNEIYVLFREVSDQYGTSKPVGVYSTRFDAEQAEKSIKRHRTFVEEFALDAPPKFEDR